MKFSRVSPGISPGTSQVRLTTSNKRPVSIVVSRLCFDSDADCS